VALGAAEQASCEAGHAAATVRVPYQEGEPELTVDPEAPVWKRGAQALVAWKCRDAQEMPALRTEVRTFWTDSSMYFLFACPYQKLNVFLPAKNDAPRVKLWDRDVVEIFLGSDFQRIKRYKEFEVAPTGDWISIDVNLELNDGDNYAWRSGWKTMARVDEGRKIWYAAARIPLSSVSATPVKAGTKWRGNLYRISGEGPDSKRDFLCWEATCVTNRDENHVPERFGLFEFVR
jgi:hypothetical protein